MEIPNLNVEADLRLMAHRATELGETGVPDDSVLRDVAEQFEAAFLSEMLKHTGIGKMPEAFNGGPGEAAFSDFLVREYATMISEKGALGLAEHVFQSLAAKVDQT